MALLPETRLIVDQVEQITERPIRFAEDAALAVIANLRIARSGAQEHVLTLRPGGESLDYVVAYQCGYVLRLYETPPDQRFDFAASPSDAADRMAPLLKAMLASGDAAPDLPAVAERMSHWLLLTLRSLPVGLRIDRWIYDTYPALREQQAASLTRQQEENAGHIRWRAGKVRFPDHPVAEMARADQTRMAHDVLRSRTTGLRMDVVTYIVDALRRFAAMNQQDVGKMTLEIAKLGESGLEINDPRQRYRIKSAPGEEFTGLQLISMMHVGVRQFQRDADTGADFDAEYAMALSMSGEGKAGAA